MVNMTLAIPENLHKLMKKHSEIRWTEIVRQAIENKALELEKKEWKEYSLRNAIKNWDDANDLIRY